MDATKNPCRVQTRDVSTTEFLYRNRSEAVAVMDGWTDTKIHEVKGDKQMIPDILIRNTFQRLQNGEINKQNKIYVFRLKNGAHFDVLASNEKTAWEILETHGKEGFDVVKVEPQVFHGYTINEIILEAKKRGLNYE